MKKSLCLTLAILMIIAIIISFLSGCIYRESIDSGRLIYVYNDGTTVILEDTDTGVQYICRSEGICPMFNADGTLHTGDSIARTFSKDL